MSELSYESPLAHAPAPTGLAVSIREIPDRGMIDLRGLASDADFMGAVQGVLGVALRNLQKAKPEPPVAADLV